MQQTPRVQTHSGLISYPNLTAMWKFIFVFALLIIQQLLSQTNYLTILRNDDTEIGNARFVAVDDSVLFVSRNDLQIQILLADVREITIAQRNSRIGTGGAIGGFLGVIAGAIIGEDKDKREFESSFYSMSHKGSTNKIQYGLIGLGAGALTGGIIGSMFNEKSEKAYVMTYFNSLEKKNIISALFNKTTRQTPMVVHKPDGNSERLSSQSLYEVSDSEFDEIKTHFFAEAGAGIPVGEFGGVDIAPANGYASTGFLLRAGVISSLNKRLYVAVEVEHSRNRVDVSEFEKYATVHSVSSWIMTVPSIGFKLCVNPTKKNLLFFHGSLGAAMVVSPHIEMYSGANSFRQSESKATDIAYTVGAAMLFGSHYNFNFSYQYLKPEFELSVMDGNTLKIGSAAQKIELISLTLGYYF